MESDAYAERSRRVAETFLTAFEPYVSERLRSLVDDDTQIAAVVAAGREALADAFAPWVAAPPQAQRRSPLELLRVGLEASTAVLADKGVAPVERDEAQRAALPMDLYDLAPPTSRDLGEEAWQAHVAWGLARAEAVAGVVPAAVTPSATGVSVALVSGDLMDRTRIESAVRAAGLEMLVWRNPAAVTAGLAGGTPVLALVDLEHGAARAAIRTLVAGGVAVVAYGPHVDDRALAAALALGAADALPRSRFFVRLPKLLPRRA